jgi:hypothetical protein
MKKHTPRNERSGFHYRALITTPEREALGLEPRKSPNSTTPHRARKSVNLSEDDWEYIKGWQRRSIGSWEGYIMPDDDEHQSLDDDALSDSGPLQEAVTHDPSRMIDDAPIAQLDGVKALLHAHDMHEGSWCYTCKRNAAPQVGHYVEVMLEARFIK